MAGSGDPRVGIAVSAVASEFIKSDADPSTTASSDVVASQFIRSRAHVGFGVRVGRSRTIEAEPDPAVRARLRSEAVAECDDLVGRVVVLP